MKLLTKETRKRIPRIGGQEELGNDAIIHVKYFGGGSWSWFATEGEPVLDDKGREVDFEFFGLVHGLEKELGYFYLSELQSIKFPPFNLGVERDLYFGTNRTLSEFM